MDNCQSGQSPTIALLSSILRDSSRHIGPDVTDNPLLGQLDILQDITQQQHRAGSSAFYDINNTLGMLLWAKRDAHGTVSFGACERNSLPHLCV